MSIKGVDENMCCGTHVSNLSHLQVCVFVFFLLHSFVEEYIFLLGH